MNAVEAIECQITAIADRVLGPEGYNVATLRAISKALCQASARIEVEIMERVGSPSFKGDAP
jgi:hypothetical protein